MDRRETMKQCRYVDRVAVVCLLALSAVGTTAQAQSGRDDFQFRATMYAWVPGINAETEFPTAAGGPSINVNANDLLSGLKMAFMGTLEGRRGQWGGMVDWFYSNVGDTKSATRDFKILGVLPLDLTADLSLDVKTNILTLAGTYALVDRPQYSSSLVFGTRMLKMDETLDWGFNTTGVLTIARNGRVEVSSTQWDAIVGAKGRAALGDGQRWFVPYYVDIGTGNSKFTWQGMVGLGYSFGWGDAIVAWRYLDYDFKSGESLKSLTFNGVGAGVSLRF